MAREVRAEAVEISDLEDVVAIDRSTRPLADASAAVARALGALGFTPNGLTYLSLFPAAGALVATATGYFVLAVILLGLSGLCDMLDGPLARESGQTSRFGALLDSTLDRFADAAPLLGLCVYFSGYGWVCLIPAGALFTSYSVSYVRARAEGLKINLPALWMRRTERLLLVALALLLAPVSIPALAVPAPLTLAIVLLVGVLSLLASIHALVVAARILKAEELGDERGLAPRDVRSKIR